MFRAAHLRALPHPGPASGSNPTTLSILVQLQAALTWVASGADCVFVVAAVISNSQPAVLIAHGLSQLDDGHVIDEVFGVPAAKA